MAVAEVADFRPTHTAAGDVYLTALPMSSLVVDHRYQRLVNPNKVRQIIETFQPGAIGALDVSARQNSMYAVIDGQHRLEVLREVCPNDLVNCVVHTNLSAADEAELFHISNMRRSNPGPADRFRARLFYQEPVAVAIAGIVQVAGLQLDLSAKSSSTNPRTVGAVAAMERVYLMGGGTLLARCLDVLHRIWPDEHLALTGEVLQGMGVVLKTYGDALTLERITNALALVPVRKLLMEAAGHRALLGGAGHTNIARAIVKHYNHGLRNRLDESELGKSSPNARVRPESSES